MKRLLLLLTCLLAGLPALSAAPAKTKKRERPCLNKVPDRKVGTQGTLLWGTTRKAVEDENSSVLASIQLVGARLGNTALLGMRLEDGSLVAGSPTLKALEGVVLQGQSSDGQPIEVAVCGAKQSDKDPKMAWYQIQIWNLEDETWENPCIPTYDVPSPRALAVRGIWDQSGAHHPVAEQFTFACENGAIAKCIDWGYAPWVSKNGNSLAPLHQACTRMARADYCGNGRSYTRESTRIDIYDSLGIQQRTTKATTTWQPELAEFEANWLTDGASCVGRMRDGRAAEVLLNECPERFEAGIQELGDGDRCTIRRRDQGTPMPILSNQLLRKSE